MQKLSTENLGNLPQSVERPRYDRSKATVGIVHIGVGGFHRAHQALYVDELMNQGEALDWGICGVGLLPGDARMRDALQGQDGLYTLMVKPPDGQYTARVIGSILQYLFLPDDPEAVLAVMAAPATRIVSLTVTEGGYNFSHTTGAFNFDDPAVARDLEPGAVPATVFGLVAEALRRRRAGGIAPFTVLSCDNVQGNGDMARRSFVAFAQRKDAALGEWMEREVAFPNGMVDRITPVTSSDDIAQVADRFGVTDSWPVVCEPFTQWVVEDRFPQGRPALERAGVQLVEHVEPYELMKLRLLNAGHQAIAYFGVLAGLRYAHETIADPLFPAFLLAYWHEEAMPTLRPVPGVDLGLYCQTLIERFGNPHVRDTLARLAVDGSERITKFLLPVVRERLAAGGSVARCAAIVASWARYAEGTAEDGSAITVVDALRDEMVAAASGNRGDARSFLRLHRIFGDLGDEPRFVQPYEAALASLHGDGALATVRRFT